MSLVSFKATCAACREGPSARQNIRPCTDEKGIKAVSKTIFTLYFGVGPGGGALAAPNLTSAWGENGEASTLCAAFCGIFLCPSRIFNLGPVKLKYLINRAILNWNANRRRLITFSRGGSIYEMSLKIVCPQSQSMPAAFPPECLICCKYRKREIWIGGRQLDAHMRFLQGAGTGWKGIDQPWVSVYGFLEAPSKAAARSLLGPRRLESTCDLWGWSATRAIDRGPGFCYSTTGSCHFSISDLSLCAHRGRLCVSYLLMCVCLFPAYQLRIYLKWRYFYLHLLHLYSIESPQRQYN